MTSPIVSTSKRPSSGSASGQISSPPPKKRPFATTTSNIGPARRSPSTATSISVASQPEKTAKVAHR